MPHLSAYGRRPLTLFALLVASALPAAADWMYRDMEVAGLPEPVGVAVVSQEYHGIGLRCEDGKPVVMYVTDDPMSLEQLAMVNQQGVSIAIEPDGGDRLVYPGLMKRINGDNTFVGRVDRVLLEALEDADRFMNVHLRIMGRQAHRNRFSVAGSTEAMRRLMDGCYR